MKESLKQYHIIKKNRYLHRKRKTVDSDDRDTCTCKPSHSAGANSILNCRAGCLNRSMYTECNPATCPCGSLCENRHFQSYSMAPVYPNNFGGKVSLLLRVGDSVQVSLSPRVLLLCNMWGKCSRSVPKKDFDGCDFTKYLLFL